MRGVILWTVICLLILPLGCSNPLGERSSQELRDRVTESIRREVASMAEAPTITPRASEGHSYLESKPERVQKLDETYGPGSLQPSEKLLDKTLFGRRVKFVHISLPQVIDRVVNNGLEANLARLQAGSSEADLVAAEAAFDATLFTEFSYGVGDRPVPQRVAISDPDGEGPLPPTTVSLGVATQVSDTMSLKTGIRKPLHTGGQMELSTGYDWTDDKTPGLLFRPDPAWSSNITLGIQQPLLRNFGTDVNRASIDISRNAHYRDVLEMHQTVMEAVAQAEQVYRLLDFRHKVQAAREARLQSAIRSRDIIISRGSVDANAVQYNDADGAVYDAMREVSDNTTSLLEASDQLKRLMNDPDLPLSDETILLPIDEPVELPVSYNLLEAALTAMNHRPEARIALLNIDDESTRLKVSRNLKLPILNVGAQLSYHGLNEQDRGLGNSYDHLTEGRFIEYLLTIQFEQPMGNRAGRAIEQRQLHRKSAAEIEYERTTKDIFLEVKSSLQVLTGQYGLIDISRKARRAAAAEMEAIFARMRETDEGFTPQAVDQWLRAQEKVTRSQEAELAALAEYSIALMRAKQAQGTLLEYNNIKLNWPEGMFSDR